MKKFDKRREEKRNKNWNKPNSSIFFFFIGTQGKQSRFFIFFF
jgi:hypothetical protein